MSNAMPIWLEFTVCAAVIMYAGAQLSRYGDIIADKTGVSGSWVGLVLMATVTSLPELVTGASSVTVANVPNIALGDVLGSCIFNLTLLVLMDFLLRGESVYHRANQGHILSAAFGILLIGFAGLSIMLGDKADGLALGHVGLYSPIIVMLYLLAIRSVFVYQRSQMQTAVEQSASRYPGITLRQAALRYAAAAAVVVVAGFWLPFIGADLAATMGWHNTFVGTLFIAGATSLPELAVMVAALRINALDMAISNLLGSNLFDIVILAIDDVLYRPGPLLSHVTPNHVLSALSAVIMSGIVIIGLLYRPQLRLMRTVGWVSIGLFAVYVLNTFVAYLYSE